MAEQGTLSTAEMLTGLEYERLIAMTQARLQTLAEAQGVFVGYLRQVHGCGDGWDLRDWAEGFVRQEEEGKRQEGKAKGAASADLGMADSVEEAENGD